jgi:hypothetical protein
MRFWTREVAGWVLLGLGLYVFYRSYSVLMDRTDHQIEGGILTIIGIFLFRGGIHLLKIAVAARVCMEAKESLERDRAKPVGLSGPSRPMTGRRPSAYTDKSSLHS